MDRDASLIQAVAFGGHFDFKRYDPTDSYHRARLKLAMDFEEQQRLLRCTQDMLLYTLSVASTPGNIKHESRVKLQDKAFDALQDRYNLEFPWDKRESKEHTSEAEAADLRQRWIDIWGDPNDPEVAARIKLVADSLMKSTNQLKLQAQRDTKTVGVVKRKR